MGYYIDRCKIISREEYLENQDEMGFYHIDFYSNISETCNSIFFNFDREKRELSILFEHFKDYVYEEEREYMDWCNTLKKIYPDINLHAIQWYGTTEDSTEFQDYRTGEIYTINDKDMLWEKVKTKVLYYKQISFISEQDLKPRKYWKEFQSNLYDPPKIQFIFDEKLLEKFGKYFKDKKLFLEFVKDIDFSKEFIEL